MAEEVKEEVVEEKEEKKDDEKDEKKDKEKDEKKDDEKDDPLLTEDRARLMGDYPLLTLKHIASEVNVILQDIFNKIDLTLIDFKLEFGYDSEQNLLLADELSPDGMRLWREGKSFDKDLFRKEKGDIVEAYNYILSELKKVIML